MMADRLGPPFTAIAPPEENPASERCEAFTPKENAAQEARYVAKAKSLSNPITAWMASMYPSREAESAWVYDHFARITAAGDFVRMMDTPKFEKPQSNAAHLAQRAEEELVPRRGDARALLWEMNR